jgi:hypothetical protein
VIAALIATFLVASILGWVCGVAMKTKQEIRERLRSIGLTKEAASLYGRAAKILRRLDGLTDLDGDFAADVLTPESKKQVSEWLADYRKGLNLK